MQDQKNPQQNAQSNDAVEMESKIHFTWIERDEDDLSRRGTMYCFKTCNVNQN